jgi:UDP-3-O-[3-hydroxymyristoyl] glucosamine N-acyltransferase
MTLAFSADELISLLAPRATRGATAATIGQIAALKDARPGDLTFLGNPKYKPEVPATRASVVLLPADFTGEPAPDQLFLLVDNPSAALATLLACRTDNLQVLRLETLDTAGAPSAVLWAQSTVPAA